MKPDPIGILEAAYDLSGGDAEWLQRIAERVCPNLDRGLGIVAYYYDASGERLKAHGFTGARADPRHIEVARVVTSLPMGASRGNMQATYRSPRALSYSSSALGPRRWSTLMRTLGHLQLVGTLRDVLILNVTDPSRRGCVLGAIDPAPSAQRLRRSTHWSQIAAHIAAGLRLRRNLRCNPPAAAVEAILSPTGSVLHAIGPAQAKDARQSLREVVLRTDQARGRLRRSDPGAAVQLWCGLVAGRWSLVDGFDSDGSRFLVAHRNAPECRRTRSLTTRERQVIAYAMLAHSNKLIAYELGLSLSVVSTYLSSALAKLGVRSRAELVTLWASIGTRQGLRT
jgi:DNA-binding CsgD family transcriptional regulator